MVVKRGVNDHAIARMAAHFRGSGHILRFIEYMDVGATNGWRMDDVVPAAEIIAAIDAHWPLEPVEPNYPGEVATRYRYRDGAGEIGVIASVTQPFCGACTRARLSADGKLYTCLFADRRPRPPRAATRRRQRRSADDAYTFDLDAAAPTATPSYAGPRRSVDPRSRCPTSAADYRSARRWAGLAQATSRCSSGRPKAGRDVGDCRILTALRGGMPREPCADPGLAGARAYAGGATCARAGRRAFCRAEARGGLCAGRRRTLRASRRGLR